MNRNRLDDILARFSGLRIAVVGDFFLDRYWLIDPDLDEPSIETGLTAYQAVAVRVAPGAAGTVVNNLAALGIGTIHAVGFVGLDGEGDDLLRALAALGVDSTHLRATPLRRTPCYTKPLRAGVEMNRFDLKNQTPTPPETEKNLIESIRSLAVGVDAIMIMDQVGPENTGVVTDAVRNELIRLGSTGTGLLIYADSRERLGRFREMIVKGNDREAAEAFGRYEGTPPDLETLRDCGRRIARRTGRTVFLTMGPRGQLVVEQDGIELVPAFPVEGEIDICGAGDATSSGVVSALCAGASATEAARFGNLIASITIRKRGETGTASPKEIREHWERYGD